jgi:signal peptidase I
MPEPLRPTPDHQLIATRDARGVVLWLRDLVISLAVSGFIIIFIYQPVKVEGTSMMPSVSDQERIFINKFVYRFEAIDRGDVIVFRYPNDPSKSYIKRVIGVPGDKVQISFGRVYVNGQRMAEPYVPEQYSDERSMPELTVPPNSYFVMGDHRNMSSDSREFGAVAREYIYGKAVFAYWPAEKMGKLE